MDKELCQSDEAYFEEVLRSSIGGLQEAVTASRFTIQSEFRNLFLRHMALCEATGARRDYLLQQASIKFPDVARRLTEEADLKITLDPSIIQVDSTWLIACEQQKRVKQPTPPVVASQITPDLPPQLSLQTSSTSTPSSLPHSAEDTSCTIPRSSLSSISSDDQAAEAVRAINRARRTLDAAFIPTSWSKPVSINFARLRHKAVPRPMQAVLHNNPITFDEVKKSSCYIFRYNLKYGGRSSIEFLTLSCPAVDCPNRVFSRNPMEDGRAGTHLKRCGLSFQDQGHMVCLYARPVIGGGPRYITYKRISMYNNSLAADGNSNVAEDALGEPIFHDEAPCFATTAEENEVEGSSDLSTGPETPASSPDWE